MKNLVYRRVCVTMILYAAKKVGMPHVRDGPKRVGPSARWLALLQTLNSPLVVQLLKNKEVVTTQASSSACVTLTPTAATAIGMVCVHERPTASVAPLARPWFLSHSAMMKVVMTYLSPAPIAMDHMVCVLKRRCVVAQVAMYLQMMASANREKSVWKIASRSMTHFVLSFVQGDGRPTVPSLLGTIATHFVLHTDNCAKSAWNCCDALCVA